MERLLVVEHNRLLGEGLALLLQWRTGLSSTHAPSLDEAKSVLEQANQKKPACIIVDLDLPGMTLLVLLVVFVALYALVDGLLAIVAGIRGPGGRRWLLLAEGALSLLAGLVVLFWPGTTALVLVYVISAWAIFTGLLKVVMAISFRRQIENGWLMGLGGALRALRGHLRLLARGGAGHFGVARRDLRADPRCRASRAGLP
jgi:hypothetical protein